MKENERKTDIVSSKSLVDGVTEMYHEGHFLNVRFHGFTFGLVIFLNTIDVDAECDNCFFLLFIMKK
jgi:hypothetical protein